MNLFYVLYLFIIYSFIGWLFETVFYVMQEKSFANRGLLNGPFCLSYGFASVLITIFFSDINNYFIYFLAIYFICLSIESLSGSLLFKITKIKWWDYSKSKYSFGIYASYIHALIFSLLALLIRPLNLILTKLFNFIPVLIMIIILLVISLFMICDILSSVVSIRNTKLDKINNKSFKFKEKLEMKIRKRIFKAYPNYDNKKFAEGLSFYKVFLMFLIGSFLGDIIETIFCRYTMGYWMSRSSLVIGDFSIVWGFAIALATIILYKHKDKKDSYIFIYGTIMGGAYEYICSVFTEIFFHTVFWDYSNIPFNLGGRINLLYCFFWGIAAVVWIKILYPIFSKLIEKIPYKIGAIVTTLLLIFIVFDVGLSFLVLHRYSTRNDGVVATSKIESYIDNKYNDDVIKNRYPNAIRKD